MLFIHRSTGANLLRQGRVPELLSAKQTDIWLDDYNQNKAILTDHNGNQSPFTISFVGNDTTPKAYAAFFNESNKDGTMLQRVLKEYDAVVIKSCYPNNAIQSDAALDELKGCYKEIVSFFANHPDKQLGIMTTPPLLASKTNPEEAARARKLADWLASESFDKNISVFDLYNLLADTETNTLRKDYQRTWSKLGTPDSHPNRKANHTIAPLFVDWLASIGH